jgi:hypothetical protein
VRTLHGKLTHFLRNVSTAEPGLYFSQPNHSDQLYCDPPNYGRRICLLSDTPVNVSEDLAGAGTILTKNLKLEIGGYVVLVLQVWCR